jgi:sec-independent protein translocase protein TatB
MFDFDAGKLIIIGIVALIVIGPKELPRVMRQVGMAVGKMRKLASEFQSQFMDAMREADVADIKAEAEKLANQAKIDIGFNPVADVKAEMSAALNGFGEALPQSLPAPATSDVAKPDHQPDSILHAESEAVLPAEQGSSVHEHPVEPAPSTQTVHAPISDESLPHDSSPPAALPHDSLAQVSLTPEPMRPLPAEPATPEPVPLRTSA